MDLSELRRKLLAAGRLMPADETVPYGFETRMAARLRASLAPEHSGQWMRALWRAALSCTAITLLLASWSVLSPGDVNSPRDFSEELENTVLAALVSDHGVETR